MAHCSGVTFEMAGGCALRSASERALLQRPLSVRTEPLLQVSATQLPLKSILPSPHAAELGAAVITETAANGGEGGQRRRSVAALRLLHDVPPLNIRSS